MAHKGFFIMTSGKNIQQMFDKVRKELKRIKVELKTKIGLRVVFKPGKAGSEHEDTVFITNGGTLKYGFVKDNILTLTKNCNDLVKNLILQFEQDPQAVAQQNGREFNSCCFCMRVLSDPISVELGYGPTCAKRWGLPHRVS